MKVADRSNAKGAPDAGELQSLNAPPTSTSAGPRPKRLNAMEVPSFEITVPSTPCAGPPVFGLFIAVPFPISLRMTFEIAGRYLEIDAAAL